MIRFKTDLRRRVEALEVDVRRLTHRLREHQRRVEQLRAAVETAYEREDAARRALEDMEARHGHRGFAPVHTLSTDTSGDAA